MCARFSLLLAFCIAFPAVPLLADSTAPLNKAVEALKNPRLAGAAEEKLKALTKDPDATVRVRARVALAGQWRLKGKAEAAVPLVEPYAELKPENLQEPRAEGFIEAAMCQAALGRLVGAYKLLDYGKEHAEGIAAIRIRETLADMMEPIPEIEKALGYLKEAKTYGDGYFQQKLIKTSETDAGRMDAAKPGHEQWPALKAELEGRIAALDRKLRIQRWGLDYVLYAEAQEARKSADPLATDFTSLSHVYPGSEKTRNVPSPGADYKAALEKYDQIIKEFPEGVFAETAKCYRNICLAKLGKVDEAIQGLESFCKGGSKSPYQGEGWKVLGDLYLQDRWDLKKAATCYDTAITWCADTRAKTEASKLYAVPAKCQEPAKPPEKWQVMTEWGGIEDVPVSDGSVVNRATASWYLDQLEEECEFNLGYTHAATNGWTEALRHFQRAGQLDALLTEAEKKGYYNAIHRLRKACAKEAFVGEEAENAGLRGLKRSAVMWADFLYLRQRFEAADSLYGRLYRVADKDEVMGARAGLGLILTAEQRNDMAAAQKISNEVVSRWPRAGSSPYALMLAGLACGPGPKCDYPEASKYFQQVYTRYPGTRVAEWARFEEVFRCVTPENLEERRSWIEKFRKDFPHSRYLATLDDNEQLLERWKKDDEIWKTKEAARKATLEETSETGSVK